MLIKSFCSKSSILNTKHQNCLKDPKPRAPPQLLSKGIGEGADHGTHDLTGLDEEAFRLLLGSLGFRGLGMGLGFWGFRGLGGLGFRVFWV